MRVELRESSTRAQPESRRLGAFAAGWLYRIVNSAMTLKCAFQWNLDQLPLLAQVIEFLHHRTRDLGLPTANRENCSKRSGCRDQ